MKNTNTWTHIVTKVMIRIVIAVVIGGAELYVDKAIDNL
ncbi:MAG: hypothetical protein JWM57_3390 [Phycisphaerales bacterium]|nr:hypothetical protein [Phycisphaerales bacterium]